ncbi:PadR family transcriptional regulator [Pseudanabaena sp. FACHB-2040]|uniref:PadR family transcriptional regulator n=1 Tax=Pseudanabaena sp. FACHB-2040 TaxID=2692859 RepID=UPI0016826A68|nr:PadR family transcriptional regulator [Pseudanabaena sp. FACHB-2040]MBD2256033.1 helix-turn-helix transcriptional regulator [Pseudanabaena sp. FACHB-2040]
MFEIAALGLLQREPLHGYRLKQQLELFMSGCISANCGTIYPLLRRLEQQGAITVVGDGASNRKIYSLTDQGRAQWQQKMMEHPQESWVNARSRFMIKFFFFAYIEPNQRIKLLANRLVLCRLRLEDKETQPLPSDPYQSAAWSWFENMLRQEISWLTQMLEQEQNKLEAAAYSASVDKT